MSTFSRGAIKLNNLHTCFEDADQDQNGTLSLEELSQLITTFLESTYSVTRPAQVIQKPRDDDGLNRFFQYISLRV